MEPLKQHSCGNRPAAPLDPLRQRDNMVLNVSKFVVAAPTFYWCFFPSPRKNGGETCGGAKKRVISSVAWALIMVSVAQHSSSQSMGHAIPHESQSASLWRSTRILLSTSHTLFLSKTLYSWRWFFSRRPPVTHLPTCEFKWWVGLAQGNGFGDHSEGLAPPPPLRFQCSINRKKGRGSYNSYRVLWPCLEQKTSWNSKITFKSLIHLFIRYSS